eukprot:SAG31_NODE_605_length_13628_cov_24.848030_16_plen_108_part_00
MDTAGFAQTKLVAADGDASVVEFMQKDEDLRNAIQIVGIHWGQSSKEAAAVNAMGKVFWNSENNDIDGVFTLLSLSQPTKLCCENLLNLLAQCMVDTRGNRAPLAGF